MRRECRPHPQRWQGAPHPFGVTGGRGTGTSGRKKGYHRKGPEAAQTDPEEARKFVLETQVDALAVSIGTAHGQYTFEPKPNIERLRNIRKAVDRPIVLHGGSGTPMEQVQEAICQEYAK